MTDIGVEGAVADMERGLAEGVVGLIPYADSIRAILADREVLLDRIDTLEGERDGNMRVLWTVLTATGGSVTVTPWCMAEFDPSRARITQDTDPTSGGYILRARLAARQSHEGADQ